MVSLSTSTQLSAASMMPTRQQQDVQSSAHSVALLPHDSVVAHFLPCGVVWVRNAGLLVQESSSDIAASRKAPERAALSAARQRWSTVQEVRRLTARGLGMPPGIC